MKYECGDGKRRAAPYAVGDPSPDEGADHAADQQKAGDQLLLERGESAELLLQVEQRA
jgi:hypothetical protein